jgi:hypothetical protein
MLMTLFLHTAAEALAGLMFMYMMWGMEIHDHDLTYIGGLSLFLELTINHPHTDKSVGTTNCVDHLLGKIPVWRLSGFSPGTCEHQDDLDWEHIGSSIDEKLMQQFSVIERLWDPGISTAQINLLQSGMFANKGDCLVLNKISSWPQSAFSLLLGITMQLELICLPETYIQDTLLCLPLAAMEEKTARRKNSLD